MVADSVVRIGVALRKMIVDDRRIVVLGKNVQERGRGGEIFVGKKSGSR